MYGMEIHGVTITNTWNKHMSEKSVNEYDICQDCVEGAVDIGVLTNAGIRIRGWAFNKNSPRDIIKIIVFFQEKALEEFPIGQPRYDLSEVHGRDFLMCGFEREIPKEKFDISIVSELKYLAVLPTGKSQWLKTVDDSYYLNKIPVSADDFQRNIQDPATRFKDVDTLKYAAMVFYNKEKGDFNFAASCLCVMGYRVIEGMNGSSRDIDYFILESDKALERAGDFSHPGVYRWVISLRLLRGYLFLLKREEESALCEFMYNYSISDNNIILPSMLTNILKSTFVVGRILEKRGCIEDAISYWREAPKMIKRISPHWEFENYFSYKEFSDSSMIAQQCYIAALIAESKQKGFQIDSAMAPLNSKVDARFCGFPIENFIDLGIL